MTQKWVAVPWESYLKLRGEPSAELREDPSGVEKIETEKTPPAPTPPAPTPTRQRGFGETTLSTDVILAKVPKRDRGEAAIILRYIEKSPILSWNASGEIVVKGETRVATHITALLKDAFREYKQGEPKGVDPFYEALAEISLPPGLIKNEKRRLLLERDEHPKPPGIVASQWLTWK